MKVAECSSFARMECAEDGGSSPGSKTYLLSRATYEATRGRLCGYLFPLFPLVETSVGENTSERHILYEDPDLGFCILAHNYTGPKESPPHDHGPSWAIYGQARGETHMTDYERVAEPAEGKPGKAKAQRKYKLVPGIAHLYNERELHSPRRDGPTQLIRIEGTNMDRVKRQRFEAAG